MRGRRRKLLPVGPCIVVLAMFMSPAAGHAAGGLTWSKTFTGPTPYGVSIDGISCSSVSLCVAVDSAGDVLTSQDPSGGAGAWHLASGVGARTGVSCPSASLCVALANNGVMVSTNPLGGAGAWQNVAVDSSGMPVSVSCPSVSLCVVGDDSGNVVTSTNPTGDASAWTVTQIDTASGSLNLQVSCASASFCAAANGSGSVFTSTNPAGGQSAWPAASLGQADAISALSCPTSSFCLGVGAGYGVVTWTTTPSGGTAAWHPVTVGGLATMRAVACASPSLCAVGGDGGDLASSTDPTGGGGAWSTRNICGSEGCDDEFVSFSCPSASLCLAGDSYEELWTGRLTGSGSGNGTSKRACHVPAVIGKTLAAATRAMRAAGCSVGRVRRIHAGRRRLGRVVSESPRAGTRIPPGTKVTLVVGR